MAPFNPVEADPVRPGLGPPVDTLARISRILERASGELSLSHYRVLTMVSAGDGRASRLAVRLALGKPAISAAVESLVSRGLLVRSGSDPDRRATQLEMTTEGRAVLQGSESKMAAALADLFGHARDTPAVIAALDDLSGALERRQAHHDSTRHHAVGKDVTHP
ncbi:MAG: MarR family winged helix-turn-helix transcriptional regulator [Candidatus Dormiibacterota bacterium]